MSKVPQKLNMPIAVTKRSNINWRSTHTTTGNFMEISVAHYRELVPTQTYNINHACFARLEAIKVPTFGFCKVHHKAFFVPYRTVQPSFTDLVNDTPHIYDNGTRLIPTKVHSIKNSLFVKLFQDSEFATQVTDPTAASDLDIILTATSSQKYNLTARGRHAFKLLLQLGYGITWSLIDTEHYHSALPLFSLARIYCDWYYPSQYSQLDEMSDVLAILNYNSYGQGFEYTFTLEQLKKVFNMLYRNYYENDLFVNAWDKPNSPNYNATSDIFIKDINNGSTNKNQIMSTNHSGVSSYGSGQGPKILGGDSTSNSSNVTGISQYALTALKSLTDYVKRHQLVGARSLDRFLSRWGIKLDADKIDRSYYLGGWMQDITFGDVTSTADTEGAQLGSYAGKGLIRDAEGNFSFTAEEYGMFLIISTIVPDNLYYQGADRTTKHLTKLDFFTPEFDNLGVQAMSQLEVYAPLNGKKLQPSILGPDGFNAYNFDNYVFGFVPRYAEYKVGKDFITGDFRRGSVNVGKDAWTFGRNLESIFTTPATVKHSIDFMHAADASQFNRIFYVDNGTEDHFNIIHRFEVSSNFPGRSLYDSYEFDGDGETKSVSMDIDGVKTN